MCKAIAALIVATLFLSAASAQAEPLRDPTRPLGHTRTASAVELELNSILVGGTRKLAVINGQQLRENDLIEGSGGIRLRRIESHAVVLQQGDNTWRLRLAGSSVRRTTPTEN